MIVGKGTLSIRCGELLVSRGHSIVGVESRDADILRWADAQRVPVCPAAEDLEAFVLAARCDVLLSIALDRLIPGNILRLPALGGINYHDALLPRYAGTHATTWAIVNGEAEHGVTWHQMDEKLDHGAVLRQERFAVSTDETVLTLNAKCYDAAFTSFSALIVDLEAGRVVAQPQDTTQRLSHRLHKRPTPGCVLDWNRTAVQLDALRRALDFGAYPNTVGLPKVLIGADAYIVRETRVSATRGSEAPGTVVAIADGTMRIATASGDLEIGSLESVDGRSLRVADVAARASPGAGIRPDSPGAGARPESLRVGTRLRPLGDATLRLLAALDDQCAPAEDFWAERLADLRPVAVPFARSTAAPSDSTDDSRPRAIWAEQSLVLSARSATVTSSAAAMATSSGVATAGSGAPLSGAERKHALAAAFLVALGRLGDATSFDVRYQGATLRAAVNGAEGVFASHVPMRVELDGARSFASLCRELASTTAGLDQHHTYSRDLVLRRRDLRAARQIPVHDLLSVVIEHEGSADARTRPPGARLGLALHDDGVTGRLLHDPDRVDGAAASKITEQVLAVLQAGLADPQSSVSTLSTVTAAERRQLLEEWNATARDYVLDRPVHRLIEEQAARTPRAKAIAFENRVVDYQELNTRANAVAELLRSTGIGRGSLVPFMMDRSAEVPIAMLGVMKAGAAFVPIDVRWPLERTAHVLRELGSTLVLTNATTPPIDLPAGQRAVRVDQLQVNDALTNPALHIDGVDPMYVIYTSGSTGEPKGAIVPHRGIANRFEWMDEFLGVSAAKAVLQASSHVYDSAVWQLLWPLTVGGATVIPASAVEANAREIVSLIDRHGVTTTAFISTVLKAVVPDLAAADRTRHALRSLVAAFVGGEEFPKAAAATFVSCAPHVRVINIYGPTEATIGCICYTFTGREDGAIPIGRPIANVRLAVLDAEMRLVPVGASGELYIAGACVGLGYLHDDAKTRAAFVTHDFPELGDGLLYRTGDIVRYRADGQMDFLGRRDRQVKVRGHRVELGEVEWALTRLPGVRDAVVDVREDRPGDVTLVAYVVSAPGDRAPGDRPAGGSWRDAMKRLVPTHMIPSAFVALVAIPRTAGGKVDRAALPAPERQGEARAAHESPRSATEYVVAEIFRDVLQLADIGAEEDFFDLGGHSLMALDLLRRVFGRLHVELPVAAIFAAPTIRGLAARIDQASGGAERSATGSRLVRINVGGEGPRVFFLPGGGGGPEELLVYAGLTRHFAGELSIYGLQAESARPDLSMHDVERMAAGFLREIRAMQPRGPYLLVGECLGAIVAWEMAQQLGALDVGLLLLMDPERPSRWRYLRYRLSRLRLRATVASNRFKRGADWVRANVRQFGGMRISAWPAHAAAKVHRALDRKAPADAAQISTAARRSERAAHAERDRGAYPERLLRYRPRPFDGRVHVLVSDQVHEQGDGAFWAALARAGSQVERVRGTHLSYIREHAAETATRLESVIRAHSGARDAG